LLLQKKGRKTVHQITRRGYQVYSDLEFGPEEREQKRIRVNDSIATTPYTSAHIPPSHVVILPHGYLHKSQQELISNISKSNTSAIPASEAMFQEQNHVESTSDNNEDLDEEIKIDLTKDAEQLQSEPTVEVCHFKILIPYLHISQVCFPFFSGKLET